jgi:hypothetical protein
MRTKLIGSAKEQNIKLTTQKGNEKDHNDSRMQQEGIIIAISANN